MDRRRAGLSLIELVIVLAITTVFLLVMASAVVTSGTMSRDTYVQNELVDLADRTADELAAALAEAGRFTDAWDYSNNGDVLEFQHNWFDANFVRIFGYRSTRGLGAVDQVADGRLRLVWVEETTGQFGSPLNETRFPPAGLDLNGNGASNDAAVRVGRLELRYYGPTNVEVPHLRRTFGGGAIRFVRDAFQGGTAMRIFSRPPGFTASGATLTEAQRVDKVVRTIDDAQAADVTVLPGEPADPAPNYPSTDMGPPDPAVQLNLRIVYNPTPGPGGRAELHVLQVSRVVAPR